jgi:PhnB protein
MDNATQSPVTPYLTVDNAVEEIVFLKKAFGAEEVNRQSTPDGKKLIHAALIVNGGVVMMSDDFPEMNDGHCRSPKARGGTSVTIHLTLPDVDATWKAAVAAGAKVVMPLADQFWGDRYGILESPSGHRWSLSTPKKKASESELKAGAAKHFPNHA